MFPIASSGVVGSGGSSGVITFSSIPQTFTHLQIRVVGKGSPSFTPGLSFYMRFNGDSGSNYAFHWLYGNGSSAGSSNATGQPQLSVPQVMADGSTSTAYQGAAIIDVLDYTNTNKNKVTKAIGGNEINVSSSGEVVLSSGLWLSTSAITSITCFTDSTNFQQYSRIDLYGISTSPATGA